MISQLALTPSIKSASVYAVYDRPVALATLQWQPLGDTVWRRGLDFWNDGTRLISCLYRLAPASRYAVRVTVSFQDGTSDVAEGTVATLPYTPPEPTGLIVVDGTNGNDLTGTGSEANPYKTIARAQFDLAPGKHIALKTGRYNELIAPIVAGTPDAWCGLRSYDPANPAVLWGGGPTGWAAQPAIFLNQRAGAGVRGAPYWHLFGLVFEDAVGDMVQGFVPDLWVSRCAFRRWARAEPAVGIRNTRNGGRLKVVACRFEMRDDPVAWTDAAITLFKNLGENSVLDCYFDLEGASGRIDGVFTGPETQLGGGWRRDGEFAENTIIGAPDDGWQVEGEAVNVRCWDNKTRDCHRAIGVAPVRLGPVWIIRNRHLVTERKFSNFWHNAEAAWLKVGDPVMLGPLFLYHNTFYGDTPAAVPTTGVFRDGAYPHVFSRNNVIVASNRVSYKWFAGLPQDWDYDALSSRRFAGYWASLSVRNVQSLAELQAAMLAAGAPQETHGIQVDDPTTLFADPLNGDFTPGAGSVLVDRGEPIPGVSDTFAGAGPDIGAVESGGAAAVYSLTISTGVGGVTDPAPGIHSYLQGAAALVTAIPAAGFRLVRWELDGVNGGAGASVSILMDRDHDLAAVFEEIPVLVQVSVTGSGTTDPAPGSYPVARGSEFLVSAIPAPGWRFVGWTGAVTSPNNPLSVTVNGDIALAANFQVIAWVLTIEALPGGSTLPVPGAYTHPQGTQVAITAIPAGDHYFVEWQEGGVSLSIENPLVLTLDRDRRIAAAFAPLAVPPGEFALTIGIIGQGTTEPVPGAYTVTAGTVVQVAAIPLEGWRFVRWVGDVASTNLLIALTMDRNWSVVAVFEAGPPPPGTALPALAIAGALIIASPLAGLLSRLWRPK